VNRGSIRFNQQTGCDIETAAAAAAGVPVAVGYNRDGQDRVRFVKRLPR